jgi:hypothetical protein
VTLTNVTIQGGTSNVSTNSIVNGTSNVAIASANGAITMVTNGNTAVTIDTAQNVGLGVTPSAWGSIYRALDYGSLGSLATATNVNGIFTNVYVNNSSNSIYKTSNYALSYTQNSGGTGQHQWNIASSGSAGGTVSFTQAMTLDNSSHLFIGTTSSLINESTLSAVSSGNTVTFKATGNASNNPLLLWNNAASGTISLISFFYNTSYTSAGSITTNGTVTTLNQPSDYRLKNVTGELTTSGSFIDALQPKVGTFKSDGSPFVGFIADEVQLVSPSSVQGTKDATKDEQYEVTPAVKDEQRNITTPAVMGTRTVPVYQSMAYDSPEIMANIIAELKSLRARLKAANIA